MTEESMMILDRMHYVSNNSDSNSNWLTYQSSKALAKHSSYYSILYANNSTMLPTVHICYLWEFIRKKCHSLHIVCISLTQIWPSALAQTLPHVSFSPKSLPLADMRLHLTVFTVNILSRWMWNGFQQLRIFHGN